MLARQHAVHIYARAGEQYSKGDPSWDSTSITWDTGRYRHVGTYLNLRQFRRWIRSESIDIVLFNEQRWWEPVIVAREEGAICGAYVDYYTAETVPLFWNYDFLICNTRRHYSVFAEHPQAIYVPWGTDTSLYSPNEQDAVGEPPVFFHSAGMNPIRKGTDLVIESFLSMKSTARLLLHSQVSLEAVFPALMSDLLASARFRHVEIVEETIPAPGLYHRGDVYIYPSRLDGVGLTVAEAASSGLFVMTTDEQPMSEFIPPELIDRALLPVCRRRAREDGYYWPMAEVDVGATAKMMDRIVEDTSELRRLKNRLRRHAVENLSWRANSADLSRRLADVSPIVPDGAVVRLARDWDTRQYPGLRIAPRINRLHHLTGRLLGLIETKWTRH